MIKLFLVFFICFSFAWSLITAPFILLHRNILNARGFEYVNPRYIYDNFPDISWTGCCILAFFLSFICPFGTLFYWLYKFYMWLLIM